MTVPYHGCSLRECAEIPDRSRQPTQFITSRAVLWPSRWRTTPNFFHAASLPSIAMSISSSMNHSRSHAQAGMNPHEVVMGEAERHSSLQVRQLLAEGVG